LTNRDKKNGSNNQTIDPSDVASVTDKEGK
jgi:hypothetical protein